nr:CDP-alcohol phosphatidyltransferase family protein [Paracoccus saliphilus]
MAAALIVHLATSGLILNQGQAIWPGAAIFLLATGLVVEGMRRHYPHDRVGACNGVTLMRLALATALLAPLAAGAAAGWVVGAVAGVALALDGVDGFLARRSGLVSQFGGRFDMEVDAALALVLALHAVAAGPLGPAVLALGLMRYAFVAAGAIWPWIRAPLPPSLARKTVCVVQLATLIVLQLPPLPQDGATVLARLAALALTWSFGRDLLWLWRHR